MKKILLVLTITLFALNTNAQVFKSDKPKADTTQEEKNSSISDFFKNKSSKKKSSRKTPEIKQNEFGYLKNDTLFLKDGNIFYVGQTIKLGYGSNDNKGFQFIYESPASFVNLMTYNGTVQLKYLKSLWANRSLTIKKIGLSGSKSYGYKWMLILVAGTPGNYWCEIVEALSHKEVITPLTKKSETKAPITSVADELKKLKELLDAGVLTQEEFDAQKKKILNQ